MHLIARSACAGVLLGACLSAGPAWAEEPFPDRALLAAADRLDVAGAVVRLEAEIWSADRGGATGAPQSGAAAATVVLRLTGDGGVAPAGLQVDGLWYVNGAAVSRAVALDETAAAADGEVIRQAAEVIDADGDGLVDVVVAVRDAAGARHLLKASAQPVRVL
jgi:hypothetical protein